MPENDTGSGVRIVFLVAVMAFTCQFDAALVTALLLDMARELRATPGGVSVAMLVFGAASGLFLAPANRLIMNAMTKALRGEAGGALSVIFNFGTLLGVALFQAAMTWRGACEDSAGSSGVDVSDSLAVGAALGALAVLFGLRISASRVPSSSRISRAIATSGGSCSCGRRPVSPSSGGQWVCCTSRSHASAPTAAASTPKVWCLATEDAWLKRSDKLVLWSQNWSSAHCLPSLDHPEARVTDFYVTSVAAEFLEPDMSPAGPVPQRGDFSAVVALDHVGLGGEIAVVDRDTVQAHQ